MIKTLSGRFLLLTLGFVLLAEVLILVPSVARFRQDYLLLRLERAQIASLALLANEIIDPELETELLGTAGIYNVVLRRDDLRQLVLSSPIPQPIAATYDLRAPGPVTLARDALVRLLIPEDQVIRVIGNPVQKAGRLIEVTMSTAPLRAAMIDYGTRLLLMSAIISAVTAFLLFLLVRALMLRPIQGLVRSMKHYAEAPEDARRIIEPDARVIEIREAQEALKVMETDLSGALRQKERLAQLGGAVAKVSHDLRNILTSAQLFADRLEGSDDPMVRRMTPKLVGSITRAVSLCETTLAFGKAEEPAPQLCQVMLAPLVADIIEAERLAVPDHDLSFAEDIPASLTLRADPEQLYRVLSNLVRNARQAIVASGEPGEIAVSAREEAEGWRITVTDTGPGLPQKAQEHLFKPFSGAARKGGVGLGLVISAELIRNHGGDLVLERTGPEGTCFTIWLPAQVAQRVD